ncbi:hypothetical protein D8674_030525 [Pyrus ussuriensis x Pyrus communis]|uniref:Uncharacterized protein n=1 Tax=Pyrus ussuriensis x Pyrus communis TaxID=2448454 RepID=A0A5N5EWC9_9ROSA|nr:hypothetical protein D8674_030525 [Pyrus ussuriensis x Pyrus communis]
MEEKKGDARVSVISGLFFVCIIAGGVFLFLYMLLPEEKTQPWYPFAGMVLVAIPWAFWIMTCLYRCFRPAGAMHTGDSGRYAKAGSSRAATIPTTSGALTVGNASSAADSSVHSPNGDRRVQFAGVVVMGNEDEGGRRGQNGNDNHYQAIDMEHHNTINDSVGSTDSEMPLRLMV